MSDWNPNGELAVVTGASSGIGFWLTKRLVENGCRVIAIARRQDRLEHLADEAAELKAARLKASDREAATSDSGHPPVTCVAGDITEIGTREAIQAAVRSTGMSLGLLVNNAGIGAIGPFSEATESRLRTIMEVNFFAPVELTRTLLPLMMSSDDAVICNVGSVLGHRAVPDKSEYCASKFALRGWSSSLRAELAPTNISVTMVSPSTTRSEFFDSLVETEDGMQSKSIGSWPPERVADATLRAIRKRRAEVILSAGGKLLVYADRISPPLMNRALRKRG